MAQVLEIGQWLLANWQVLVADVIAVLSALIALFLLIPGDQPEKALQGAVDFLKKISAK